MASAERTLANSTEFGKFKVSIFKHPIEIQDISSTLLSHNHNFIAILSRSGKVNIIDPTADFRTTLQADDETQVPISRLGSR